MLNAFNGNLVHPAISQIIFVGQFQPIGPDGRIEFCASAIPDVHICTFPIRVRETVHDGLLIDGQPEQIQMSVLSSHHHLEHFMEGMKADGTRHDHFAPNRWLNARQLDVQVVAALRLITAQVRLLFSVLFSSKAGQHRKSKTTQHLSAIFTLFALNYCCVRITS